MDEEHKSGIAIYDVPPDGMDIVLPVSDGVDMTLHITDEQAEFIIRILQNKLDGRFTK